jgi:hypothetical protein
MKTLFVTGGAGFIGSAFVRLALDEDEAIRVINFDALTYAGNPENLADIDPSRHTLSRTTFAIARRYSTRFRKAVTLSSTSPPNLTWTGVSPRQMNFSEQTSSGHKYCWMQPGQRALGDLFRSRRTR